jgi:hypothetical protein
VGRAAKRPKGKAEGRSLDPHGAAGRVNRSHGGLFFNGCAEGLSVLVIGDNLALAAVA